jgi:hypothetical protein
MVGWGGILEVDEVTRSVGGAFGDEVERVRAIEHPRHDVGGTQVRVDGWEDEDGDREYGVSVYKPRKGMTVSEAWELVAALRSAVSELDAVTGKGPRPSPRELLPIEPNPANYPRPKSLAIEQENAEWSAAVSNIQFFNANIRCASGRNMFFRVEFSRDEEPDSPLWISPNFTREEDALEWTAEAIKKFWMTFSFE